MPAPQFTPGEVLEIRHQNAHGQLDVKMWADVKLCSLETIRRIARGETYRHVAGVKAHPQYGGLRGAGPASGQRPPHGRQSPAASFVAPSELPSLADVAEDAAEADVAASLARLQASLAMPVPGDTQASAAATLLGELEAAGREQRPTKPDAELG
jgi:hypothetical protein